MLRAVNARDSIMGEEIIFHRDVMSIYILM